MDWGEGTYEITAGRIAPAAEVLIGVTAPTEAETVVDLGAGTGNASVLAAASAGRVIAVDPSERLLGVTHDRAVAADLTIDTRIGDAATIPLADASVDIVVSVFGLIFAPEPAEAANEIARVLNPGGRLIFSAWQPEGPIFKAFGKAFSAIGFDEEERFGWHETDQIDAVFSAAGFSAPTTSEHSLVFNAPSVEEYVDGELSEHPLFVNMLQPGSPVSREALRDALLTSLTESNENPAAFAATSYYSVLTLRKN